MKKNCNFSGTNALLMFNSLRKKGKQKSFGFKLGK